MSKTPLELTEDILRDNNFMLELNGIFRGLLRSLDIKEDRTAREEIVRALAYRINTLTIHASNVFWSASELKKVLTKQLEAEDPELAQQKIDKDEEVTADGLPFC